MFYNEMSVEDFEGREDGEFYDSLEGWYDLRVL